MVADDSYPTTSDLEEFLDGLTAIAEDRDLIIWEGHPEDLPEVRFPVGTSPDELCTMATRLGVKILYVSAVGRIGDEENPVTFVGVSLIHGGVSHELVLSTEDEPGLDLSYLMGFDFEDDDREDSHSGAFGDHSEESRAELMAGIEEILKDVEFDPYESTIAASVIARHLPDLDPDDFELVEDEATQRFYDEVEPGIDQEAKVAAARFIDAEDLDPFFDRTELATFAADRLAADTPDRVLRRIAEHLQRLIIDRGIWDAAMERISAEADEILDRMDPLERDRLGFSGRWVGRMQILEPYLEGVAANRKEYLARQIVHSESVAFGARRERRYGTAASILTKDHGVSRAAAARILSISSSSLDRVLTSLVRRASLDAEDPIRTLDERL